MDGHTVVRDFVRVHVKPPMGIHTHIHIYAAIYIYMYIYAAKANRVAGSTGRL